MQGLSDWRRAARASRSRKRNAEEAVEDCEDAATSFSTPVANRKRGSQASGGKGKRMKGTKAEGTEEKRSSPSGSTVRWLKSPSIKTRERMYRALPNSGHRLFLVDRKTVAPVGTEGGPVEEFAVLGATGNVYTVRIGRHPSCSCPDAAKGNLCKHHLFIMLRVLKLDQADPLVWQKALLTSEVECILANSAAAQRGSNLDRSVLAADTVREQYRRRMGGDAVEAAGAGEEPKKSVQRPLDGSDCPICYDEMKAEASAPSERIIFCALCGNNVHQECFARWSASKRGTGQQVTCVYCRAHWQDPSAPTGAKDDEDDGGYLNLAAYSDAHRRVDTSVHALYGDNARWIGRRGGW